MPVPGRAEMLVLSMFLSAWLGLLDSMFQKAPLDIKLNIHTLGRPRRGTTQPNSETFVADYKATAAN